jgi:hypothetical protein
MSQSLMMKSNLVLIPSLFGLLGVNFIKFKRKVKTLSYVTEILASWQHWLGEGGDGCNSKPLLSPPAVPTESFHSPLLESCN